MNKIINNFNKIKSNIENSKLSHDVKIIAISKTFPLEHIKPLIDYGHNHFGENKVQEATAKWTELKNKNPKIKLHMVGKLQTNKAKDAVKLFDYVHSLDSKKLADILVKQEKNLNKKIKIFYSRNIGKEIQKSEFLYPS